MGVSPTFRLQADIEEPNVGELGDKSQKTVENPRSGVLSNSLFGIQSAILGCSVLLTSEGPFPAIVCLHGGGFRAGSRKGYDAMCVRLAQEGYVAVTVTYRLSPADQFPPAVHDCKAVDALPGAYLREAFQVA